jgi:hypothetical protein
MKIWFKVLIFSQICCKITYQYKLSHLIFSSFHIQPNFHLNTILSQIEKVVLAFNQSNVDGLNFISTLKNGMYDGITDDELINLAAETAAYMCIQHPDYGRLSSKFAVWNIHKNRIGTFSETVEYLYNQIDPKTGENTTNLSEQFYETVMKHKEVLNNAINQEADYDFDYFGIKTLEK